MRKQVPRENCRRALILLAAALAGGPAPAETDLSGVWAARYHEDFPERIRGPEIGDHLGLPVNEAARRWADGWDPSRLMLPAHQCRAHTTPLILRGPLSLRIWEQRDPRSQEVIAIEMYISAYEQRRTVWMDGRAHPPAYAPHTWQGFSTGRWEGDTLTITTTHLKQGWHRHNGTPQSDRAAVIEHFMRHGDYLTHVSIVEDPVFLSEPLIRSQNFVSNAGREEGQDWLWPCAYVQGPADRRPGEVPHFLPGQNPFLAELALRHPELPEGAARGGAETMYPDYIE